MRKSIEDVKYGFYIMVHPFKGFWDIKHERKAGSFVAVFWVLAVILTRIVSLQFTGYLFRTTDPLKVNFIKEIAIILIGYFVFCAANWGLTTLMDGKGTFREICIVTACALIPYVVFQLPLTVLSNLLSTREGQFYFILSGLSYLWAGALLFLSVFELHEYSFGKTIGTMFLIVLAMGLILFIVLLFFNVIQQMLGFFYNYYREFVFRFAG